MPTWIRMGTRRQIQTKIEAINILHERSLQILEAGKMALPPARFIVEFVEDLGRHKLGVPATWWTPAFFG